jgi:hypothetical protein
MDAGSPVPPWGRAPRTLGHLGKRLREHGRGGSRVRPTGKSRPVFAPHICRSRPSRAHGVVRGMMIEITLSRTE